MSRKSMRPAHNRHINHGKDCPICNPPKGEWVERWKERKAPEDMDRIFEKVAQNKPLAM
jgi:hypothetical protein